MFLVLDYSCRMKLLAISDITYPNGRYDNLQYAGEEGMVYIKRQLCLTIYTYTKHLEPEVSVGFEKLVFLAFEMCKE